MTPQNTSLSRSILLLFLFVFGLLGIIASGGGGGGAPTPTGGDPSAAAKTSTLPPGDPDCPNGGILVETGIDENGNGVLDADEVDGHEKVCNGSDGANGLDALVKISDEPPGAQCADGGKRIDSGLDANGDGLLDAGEIASTDYVCNGAPGASGNDGLNALIDMNPEPVGINCPNGGLRIDTGIDDNGNGSLEPGEIDQTGYVCEGGYGRIGWGVASALDFDSDEFREANAPQIAMNAAGDAVAVWEQYDGSRNNIWANRYTVGKGWGLPQLIETDNAGAAMNVQVSVSANGDAVAVWQQYDGMRDNVWANRYEVGTGWQTAELIETGSGNVWSPQVAMDASGNAVVVWQQYGGTRYNIWANRYEAGTGWETAELIETGPGDMWSPQVAMDASGNAMAVWRQWDGSQYSIWANRYEAGTGWQTAELIKTGLRNMKSPQVAMDASGNAVAVWQQYDGTRYNIWANRYETGTGWQTAELIETDDTGSAEKPQVAMDASGNAVAVWSQWDGSQYSIWANRYEAGWGTAGLIETDAGNASSPAVAMDTGGNAVAVWQQYDGTRNNIWANRYETGTGWQTAELIETDNMGFAYWPQVAMDDNGHALAVWQQYDGTRYSTRSNRYTAGTGWDLVEIIEIGKIENVYQVSIAQDANGNAVAVWQQQTTSRLNVWANRYELDRGWGTPRLIESQPGPINSASPEVAMDANGNAVAVWSQWDGAHYSIWTNRYQPGTGWGTAHLIEFDDSGNASTPKVSMNANGNTVVVWKQFDGTRDSIWSNRFLPGFGWGTAEPIETGNSGNADDPQIAMDANGNAVAVWQQYDGTRHNIRANRYEAGAGWGTAAPLETRDGDARSPQVAADAAGNATAVWQQFDGAHISVYASRYQPGTGWGPAELLETDDTGAAVAPQVAVDASGNVTAVWQQWDGWRDNIWASRHEAGSGWGTPELIETNNAGDASSPQITLDADGNALAVWLQDDGVRVNVWANRYVPGLGWGRAQVIETGDAGDAYSPRVSVDGSGNGLAAWIQNDGTRNRVWANRWVAP